MNEQILIHIVGKLEERRQQLIEALADGNVKDFAEYRYLCGTIRGLNFAQTEIQDLVRRLKEMNDE